MSTSTQYDEYASGRDAIFKFLDKNVHASVAIVMAFLHEKTAFGSLKQQTIKNYMCQWRLAYLRNGRVPRLHSGLGRLDSGFDVGLWEAGPSYDWKISRNTNRERLWFESEVTLCWHRSGTILFRFKGFKPPGHLLAVFVHAFWRLLLLRGMSEREAVDSLQTLFKERYHQIGRHSTYETGEPLPRIVIDRKRSHGEVIKLGDGSHPTSVEIEETAPFWASNLKDAAAHMTDAANHMAKNLQSHVEVMRETKRAVIGLERVTKQVLAPVRGFHDDDIRGIMEIVKPEKGFCIRCLQRKLLPYSAESIDSWDRVCEDCAKALLEKLRNRGAAP